MSSFRIWGENFSSKVALFSFDHNDIMVGGGNMLLLSLLAENFNGEATIEAQATIFSNSLTTYDTHFEYSSRLSKLKGGGFHYLRTCPTCQIEFWELFSFLWLISNHSSFILEIDRVEQRSFETINLFCYLPSCFKNWLRRNQKSSP